MAVFAGLSTAELGRLAAHLHMRDVPANTSLFAVEQPGEVVTRESGPELFQLAPLAVG